MNRNLLIIISLSILSAAFSSCNLEEYEPYDLKFIHIMDKNASSTNVSSKANTISTYNVYLSVPASEMKETVNVQYDIIVGNGLKEGVDYKLLTEGKTLTFLSGIYDMPIRIQWISHPIDPTKDNTLKIVLVSNDKGYALGLPGPAQNQKEFTIIKI
ncbi:MAG: hypothetical protein WCR12_05200 [Dysgonamonadaceae bacterium]